MNGFGELHWIGAVGVCQFFETFEVGKILHRTKLRVFLDLCRSKVRARRCHDLLSTRLPCLEGYLRPTTVSVSCAHAADEFFHTGKVVRSVCQSIEECTSVQGLCVRREHRAGYLDLCWCEVAGLGGVGACGDGVVL